MHLSASPVVTDAVYQLESMPSWPLDNLQSLSFSFTLSALDDPAAMNALVVGLVLTKDSSYHLDCLIYPTKTDGMIQCRILSPTQTSPLSEAVALTLGQKHIAILVFQPQDYSVQFFLDDQYQGQGEILSVPYWRVRNFKLQIKEELQNFNSGSFSSELESIDLAHQP